MINPEKVRLMTQITSFEKKNKRLLEHQGFFKGDYIGFNSFKVLIGVTISLLFFFAADIGIKFTTDMQKFIEFDFMKILMDYITIWIIFIVIYSIITNIVFRRKYNKSVKATESLERMLKKLKKY